MKSHGGIRSMSAAARRNDSSSQRIDPSLTTTSSSTNYNKSTKQYSAAETNKSIRASNNSNSKDEKKQRAADWRAWFSSIEYDDPWSPYRPLLSPTTTHQQQQQLSSNTSNNATNSSQNIVENILTNYNDWKRRRHGMNLVPLSLVHWNVFDSNLDSPDSQHHNNIKNNNITRIPQTIIKLQKRTEWIDTQTRFTIQMLHDLYSTGIRRQMDRSTVERCHRMIGRLLSLTPRDGNVVVVHVDCNNVSAGDNNSGVVGDDNDNGSIEMSGGNQMAVEITGAAQRGNAILERMEGCSPAFLPQLRKWQRQQELQQRQKKQKQQQQEEQGGSGLDVLFLQEDASTEQSTIGLDGIDDYYHTNNKIPKHLIQTKQAIPTPTRAIYNMVLLMYGKEAGTGYVAEQAEDVVWGMIVRGLQLEEFNKSHDIIDEKGATTNDDDDDDDGEGVSVPLYPSTQNWNCVLQCWSNSTDPNRAFYAYSFFKSWMEWNDRSRGKVMEGASSCDLQSFHWMLQSCLVDEFTMLDDEVGDSDASTSKKLIIQRAKEIGSRVAIGIWRDMRAWRDQNNEVTLTLDTYEQLLRALCQTTDRSRGLLAAVASVFQSCRSDGMETKQITDLVRGVMTEAQFQKLLRSEKVSAAKN